LKFVASKTHIPEFEWRKIIFDLFKNFCGLEIFEKSFFVEIKFVAAKRKISEKNTFKTLSSSENSVCLKN
jgi:hypothetical protein